MRIFLAILGFIVGNLLGIAINAVISPDSSPFILATVSGIICAVIGYNLPKNQSEK